jgi:hypothetical protein
MYRTWVDIIWPVNNTNVMSWCSKNYNCDIVDPGDFGGLHLSFDQASNRRNIQLIALNTFKQNDKEDMDSLCHEAFHATISIMNDRGIPLSKDSNEAYAYLIGNIVRHSLAAMDTKRRPNSILL